VTESSPPATAWRGSSRAGYPSILSPARDARTRVWRDTADGGHRIIGIYAAIGGSVARRRWRRPCDPFCAGSAAATRQRSIAAAVTIEFATSVDNPTFRIYRVASRAPLELSFVRDVHGPEQLVIFDGDEGKVATLHHDTELRLQKLTERGRLLARRLLALPLRGIYIAIDQLQLTARGGRWDARVHEHVTDVLRETFAPTAVEFVEISWQAILNEPDELP
jgi:hypothetical protein